MNNCYKAEWTTVKGVKVLAIKGLGHIVAVPVNDRRNARRFAAIHLKSKTELCQLDKSEVTGWLCTVAKINNVPFNAIA